MKYNKTFKSLAFAAIAGGMIAVSGCANEELKPVLRVIHASPDAPPVNVSVTSRVSSTTIEDLDYATSSGYQSVMVGPGDISVEAIIPGGNAEVISVPGFRFLPKQRYNVIAVNETANIEPLVVEESAAKVKNDEVGIAVAHASPAAGEVDVYVTAPADSISNLMPTFTFDYKEQVDAGALPAGEARIRATAPGTKDVVYDSGKVDLQPFAGGKLLLVAVSTTSATNQLASPIKLLAATDDSQLLLLDADTAVGARVVHLSPDAGTAAGGPVEVYATSDALGPAPVEIIDAFSYTDIVPGADAYIDIPGGDYTFDVAPNTGTIGDSVYTSPALPLQPGTEYTAIAAGYVLTTPAFGLLLTGDENRAVVTQASVKVVHGAPAAGAVDVYVTPAGAFTTAEVVSGAAGSPLLPGFEFGDITDYVAVAPGDYDIRVVAGGAAAINVEGFNLAAGSVSTVIAREPIDAGEPSTFGVVVLTNQP